MAGSTSVFRFLRELHIDGIAEVGPREHLAVERLLADEGLSVAATRAAIASIVATDERQWARIATRFDEVFLQSDNDLAPVPTNALPADEPVSPPGAKTGQLTAQVESVKLLRRGAGARAISWSGHLERVQGAVRTWFASRSHLAIAAFFAAAVGVLAVVFAAPLLIALIQTPVSVDPRPPPAAPDEPSRPTVRAELLIGPQVLTVPRSWRLDPAELPWPLYVFAGVLFLGLTALGLHLVFTGISAPGRRANARQALQEHQANALDALEEEMEELGGATRVEHWVTTHPAVSPQAIDDSAEHLGRIFRAEPGRDLAARPTLDRTIEAGGCFSPVLAPRRVRSEVLVLVHREAAGNHPYLPGFLRVLEAWQRLGVRLLSYHYEESMHQVFDPETGQGLDLGDLARRTRGLPVIIFSRRLRLERLAPHQAAPWLAELRHWPHKAWVDPDPRPAAQREKFELQNIDALAKRGLVRFPLTDAGIVAMARWLAAEGEGDGPGEWGELAPPVGQDTEVDEALRRWALVASLVPDPTWDQLEGIRRHFPTLRERLPRRRDVQRLIEWVRLQTGDPEPELGQNGRCLNIPYRFQQVWLDVERECAGDDFTFEDEAHRLLISQLEANPEGEPRLIAAERLLKLSIHRAQREPEQAWKHLGWAFGPDSPVAPDAERFVQDELERRDAKRGAELPRGVRDAFGQALGKSRRVLVADLLAPPRQTSLRVAAAVAVFTLVLSGLLGLGYEPLLGPLLERELDQGRGELPATWALEIPPPAQGPAELPAQGLVKLVVLPAGSFLMGSPTTEPERDADEFQHRVTLTRPFAMGKTEVTQAQYETVMGEGVLSDEKWAGKRCLAGDFRGADLPLVCVSWLQAVRFANALSTRENLSPAYTLDGDNVTWNQDASGYRLPTEAEWEYAARAGSHSVYVGTSEATQACQFANVANEVNAEVLKWQKGTRFDCDDGYIRLSPVGAPNFEPNAWGLAGLGGNASEWVWDWFADFKSADVEDPTGTKAGGDRVIRGASWDLNRRVARVADRGGGSPGSRGGSVGFRLARSCLPSALLPSSCLRPAAGQ